MFKTIFLQLLATFFSVLIAAFFLGARGALSAGLGGLICTLPNFLFALRLACVANRPGSSYHVNFFLGEFVKMAVIVGLLASVSKVYADVHWPFLLLGLGLALQAGFLAFWKKS